ncbi:MAG TPA: PAS domain S-box protein [Solirubrobacteraceae bacterium]|nr:PAS domain S-box protein [Solirubrobacteraceae bacterium]
MRPGAATEAEPTARSRQLAAHTALLDLTPDAIFALDADRRITFWNRGAQTTYGWSPAEALGADPGDLLRTEYPIPLEEIERFVTETGGWEGDLVQHARDGRRLVVESCWAAQYDKARRLVGLLEVNRDITARLQSQTAMLELAPDAIVGIGPDGLIVLINAQVDALFGYAREELLGQPVEVLVPERFRDAHRFHRVGYFADPRTRPMGAALELFGRRRDGAEFPAEISLSSIETEDGTLAIAAIRDVSERVAADRERERLQTEAERERLQNQLHQAQRLESLGQLAGGIAHDFNNLLAVIINYAAFIANDLDAASGIDGDDRWRGTRDDVEQIRLAGERAAHLTHQLLSFARRDVVQPEVVDVNDVVGDIEQLLRRTLGEHIELHSSLAADLCPVLIDPGQLEQVLVNLAVNARDAMPDCGALRIDTANMDIDEDFAASRPELSPGPHICLRVSDTGIGMSPETVQRAFDPFFTTKPPGQGTGLGLATVYGIIQQAGGRLQIYSEPDVGSTFTVLLPATNQVTSSAARSADSPVRRGEETILLVEDEQALREVTRRILTGAGYQVIVAENGPKALAAASGHAGSIDLLLSDVIMPQMPGPQLAKRLLAERPSVRVLLMSGFAQPILDSGGHLDVGMALIEKPFSGPGLLAKVAQTLERIG